MKKSQRKRKTADNDPKTSSEINGPWLSKRTGLLVIIFLSLGLALYITWQLYPSEGLGALLWGLGFAASIWVIFGFFYLFNTFVRGKR